MADPAGGVPQASRPPCVVLRCNTVVPGRSGLLREPVSPHLSKAVPTTPIGALPWPHWQARLFTPVGRRRGLQPVLNQVGIHIPLIPHAHRFRRPEMQPPQRHARCREQTSGHFFVHLVLAITRGSAAANGLANRVPYHGWCGRPTQSHSEANIWTRTRGHSGCNIGIIGLRVRLAGDFGGSAPMCPSCESEAILPRQP
jgi:hypothetical protein